MKLQGLGKYKSLRDLILAKICAFRESPKAFSTLFKLMFSEEENVIAERLAGYKIVKTTYGEAKKNALKKGAAIEKLLKDCPKDSFVGLDMANGLGWIEAFWGILLAGYKPLLINSRLPKTVLEEVIQKYGVQAVVSDGATFNSCPTYQEKEILLEEEKKEEDFTFGTEVVFMSSGTQGEVKLCAYTAELFYYQICDTYYIVQDCPQIAKGYEGQIKQLALLPFYHVFGFIAVYLWFGFFSRTFVFLKDLAPQTLLNTVRRHKVTHIFAVPLVWETIYKSAMSTITAKGEKTVAKVQKGLRLAKSKFGKLLTRKAFGEVREQIFGDSVQFMISGGSSVSQKAVEFLNGIGYHLANGYGMTELGITSVELSLKDSQRNSLSIGKPFRHAEYKVEKGELWVRSQTRAARILFKGEETRTDYEAWFKTGDLAREEKDGFYIEGRQDDLIVSETGENLNPNLVEDLLRVEGVSELCLFQAEDGVTTLLLSCPKAYAKERLDEIRGRMERAIEENRLGGEIRRLLFTSSPLLEANDFKVSRKKVARRYAEKAYKILTDEAFVVGESSELTEKLKALFASVLEKSVDEIGACDNFFSVLGGNSLDYFTLIGKIREETGASIPVEDAQNLATVKSIEEYILRSK